MVAGIATLTVVGEDRVRNRVRAAVVEIRREEPQPPERRSPHLASGRPSLRDAVAEAPHVVQQEIRIGRTPIDRRRIIRWNDALSYEMDMGARACDAIVRRTTHGR